MSAPGAEDESPDAVTALIVAADAGDRAAREQLFTTLYRELHRLAARQLHARGGGEALGATTLLHECWLDMADRDLEFPDRGRFLAYAARAMRGLVVDSIRERKAIKRGGAFHLTVLDTQVADETPAPDEMTALRDALADLEEADAPLASLVDLKFFCGLSTAEIASLRGVSERTVERDWHKVRLLLHDTLKAD